MPNTIELPADLITAQQAAELKGLKFPDMMRRYARRGLLSAYRLTDNPRAPYLFSKAEVEKFTPPPRGKRVKPIKTI